MAREAKPLSGRARRLAWIVGGAALVAILAWVVTLPMRQARFHVVDHRMERAEETVAVRGLLRNRGPAARNVLVEAYLYDGENRWLGTTRATLGDVPADSLVPFAVPIDAREARAIERYSLYVGLEPNPLAPGM